MPAAIDGTVATEQTMAEAHDAVVRFQKESDDYQTCLVTAIADHHNNPPFFSRFHDDGFETDVEKRKHDNQMTKVKVVGNFNTAVRTYNAIHP